MEDLLKELNEQLSQQGIFEIAVCDPTEILPSEVNAHYMPAEMFLQLTENIVGAGNLESVPLVYRDPEAGGRFRLISGNHRVEAAKAARLSKILVMVISPENKDDIISKQLAHNAINGLDDKAILAGLFNSISDIQKKMASGLADAAGKVNYTSLNFRIGNFKEFTLLFIPEDVEYVDNALDEIVKESTVKPGGEVRIVPASQFDKFKKAMLSIKRTENIKSNGSAVYRMAELALERLAQIKTETETDI